MDRKRTFVAAVCVMILAGCHGRPTVEKPQPPGGAVRHVVDATVVTAPGTVEPWYGEVKLACMEPGQLSEVLVAEGQQVRKGDLLARLEGSQQRHAVLIAESELRQAAAGLTGTSSTKEALRAAAAELQAAVARAEQQRRESQRAASLGASGVLAEEAVERMASASRVEHAARDARGCEGQAARRWRRAGRQRHGRPTKRLSCRSLTTFSSSKLASRLGSWFEGALS